MKRIIVGCWFLFCTGIVEAQTKLTTTQLQLLDRIATQDVPAKAPGIATAIIQNGKVIYKKVAGYANLEDSTFITERSRFNIASNGKQFTALAILLLMEQKKLSLTDDVRTYFPDLFPLIKDSITIRHLLTHSSGIRDVYDLWSLQGITWWKQTYNNKNVFNLLLRQQELNFQPGSEFLYSNSNYMLLALIIEKVTGQTFQQFTSSMFRALGMHQTSFEDDYTVIRQPVAKAYFNFGSWTGYKWLWNATGDGNLFSTLKDQIRWELLLQGKGRTGISRSLLQRSQHLVEGSSIENYGYGLEFGMYKQIPYRFHEGATGAWKATVIRFPSQKTTMITLTNTGKSIPSMQTRQMADVVFNLKNDAQYFITQPSATGPFVSEEEITGIYLTPSYFSFQFEKRKDQLFLKRSGRNDVALEREASNIFHQVNDPAFKQEFTRNEKGELQVTAYYTTHAPYTLTQTKSDWSLFQTKSVEGVYKNHEINVTLTVQHQDEQNYRVIWSHHDTSKALLVTPSLLLFDGYAAAVTKDEQGSPALLLNGNRVKRMRFTLVKKE
jgi:CubicO group peptidase (beta-lactamase class C family)